MIARVLLGLGLLLSAADAHAVPWQHGPFEPGESVQPSPLIVLALDYSAYPAVPRSDEFVHRAEKITNLRINWAADGTAELKLLRDGKRIFSGPLEGYGSAAMGAGVYSADFNADGLLDYAVITHSGGCGLASQTAWITFLLSASGGYVRIFVSCWAAEPSDFIELNGRLYLVHTSFVQGNVGKDGRQHNYWVYNLLTFSGTKLVLANERDVRFPEWVLYSFAENHRDTDQLTSAQRRLSLKQIVEAD